MGKSGSLLSDFWPLLNTFEIRGVRKQPETENFGHFSILLRSLGQVKSPSDPRTDSDAFGQERWCVCVEIMRGSSCAIGGEDHERHGLDP